MGIFSDKCMAIIDPETGRALSGDALAEAKEQKKPPRCGNTVRKAARFCNVCGTPAPGGWWRCPGCRKWIGNDSKFCPHCDTPLFPEDRAQVAGGGWSKPPHVFAKRLEIGDIKRLLKNDLQVQIGTVALLLDGGKYKGMLEAGRHNPDSLLRKINHFGDPPPRSAVLVDAGDVALPVRVADLQTADHFPIEFYGEVILRFENTHKAALAFLGNLMGERRELHFPDMLEGVQTEIRHAVDAMCVKSTVDDLVRDPERRLRMSDEITRFAGEALKENGMQLVRVSSAEFTGDEYEAHAKANADVEVKRREVEYAERMRALTSEEQMSQFKSEQELRDYQETLAHEFGISEARREREQQELIAGWQRQDELTDLRHRLQVESAKQTGELGLKVEWEAYERDRREKDAQTAAQVRHIAFEQEKAEKEWADKHEVENTTDWLKVREEKNRIKAQKLQADADRQKGMNGLQLLADIKDPDQRENILAAMKLQAQAGMTPEQLLAMAAERSDVAASAIASMKQGEAEKYRELKQEIKTLYTDTADRQERMLETTIEPAVEAAKRSDNDQTIIK